MRPVPGEAVGLRPLARAAADELRDLRDPDAAARELSNIARLTALTIERFWLPNLDPGAPDPTDTAA